MPSPFQSNWRLYVEPETEDSPRDAICFFKTVLDHGPMVFASRLLADGLPAHRPLRMEHERTGNCIRTRIFPGNGSSPDLDVEIKCAVSPLLPRDMERAMGNWRSAVEYLVKQNRAVRVIPAKERIHESRIGIPIRIDSVEPAIVQGIVDSQFLRPVIQDCEPFAFVVSSVDFRTLGEGWTARLSEMEQDATV